MGGVTRTGGCVAALSGAELFADRPVVHTPDREEAVERVFLPNRVQVVPRSATWDMRLNAVTLGSVRVAYLGYGTDARVVTAEPSHFHVDVPVHGTGVEARPGGLPAVHATTECAAVFSPDRPVEPDWQGDCGQPERPWSAGTLAREALAGVRSLQEGFPRDVGIPPMTYRRHVRLRRAHEELSNAMPGTASVVDAAARWGFFHYGRFASLYREKFGVRPSETLRRAGRGRRPAATHRTAAAPDLCGHPAGGAPRPSRRS
jgi:AraC-like DNA-binding protein